MSELVGWTPLSSLGEAVIGDLGSELDVRLVTSRYGVGILTNNSDPLATGYDPYTGTQAPIGTDVGFGAALRRFIQSGIYNSDFYSRPSNTADIIDDYNSLPYWRIVPSASSNISAQWVNRDPAGAIRWTIPAGSQDEESYLEQIVPIHSSKARTWAYIFNGHWSDASAATAGVTVRVSSAYLRSDALTVTGDGGIPDERTLIEIADRPSAYPYSYANGFGAAPADAAYLRLRLGVRRAATTSNTLTVNLNEGWLSEGNDWLITTDDALPDADMAFLYKTNNLIFVGSDNNGYMAIASNGQALFNYTAPADDNNASIALTKGINFPNTAVASSDANTLDDYEEGSWTPVLSATTLGNLTVVYSIQSGVYVKIGRNVFIKCRIKTSTFTHTTAAGYIQVTGLPFTATGFESAGAFFGQGWTLATNWIQAQVAENTTVVYFPYSTTAANINYLGPGNMPTGGTVEFGFSLHYIVA